MSDTPEGGTTTQPATAEEPAKTFTQEQLDKIVEQRLARERSKFADYEELKAKADKLAERENADKSEVDRAREAAEAAKKEAETAKGELLRMQIAADKGLSPSQAKRLVGATREELEADADDLLEAFKPADDKRDSSRRPKEKLRPGASNEDDDEPDPKKIADKILARDY